jgi:hypothetical protein
MDFVGPLPMTKKGHDYLFNVVDKTTNMLRIIPTTKDVDGPGCARLFFRHVFRHHGIPLAIISDRDGRFTSGFWQTLFELTGTKLKMSSAYHPQTDGTTERANRTIEDMLRAYVNDRLDDWDEHLTAVEFAYNRSVHASTGFSPFHLNYGRDPLTPEALLTPPKELPKNQAAGKFLETLRKDLASAQKHLDAAREKQKKYADSRRKDFEFNEGDLVLLSSEHLNIQRPQNSNKLTAKRVGPFKIIRKLSPVSYTLELPPSMTVHPTFHISLLTPYRDPTVFPERDYVQRPAPEIVQDQQHFEIEKFLAEGTRYGYPAILVKYTGYDDSHNEWQFVDDLKDDMDQSTFTRFLRDLRAQVPVPKPKVPKARALPPPPQPVRRSQRRSALRGGGRV